MVFSYFEDLTLPSAYNAESCIVWTTLKSLFQGGKNCSHFTAPALKTSSIDKYKKNNLAYSRSTNSKNLKWSLELQGASLQIFWMKNKDVNN